MDNFFISAIQQVGVGTENFRATWDWYIRHFGFDIRILEDDTVAERMLPYTGNQAQKRHACIAVNLQGGSGLEIWQYSLRKPKSIDFEIQVGDLGIMAAKIKCRDVEAFRAQFCADWPDCGPVEHMPDGTPYFWTRDLYGNWLQVIERKDVFIGQGRLTGGVIGAVVGVSDMESSIKFYSEVLGYNRVVSDTTGAYGDGYLPSSLLKCRRVILAADRPVQGAFAAMLGSSTIELVQALERTPRKIYEGRFWGDPGFIQICFDITGMRALGDFCASKGHPFTVDSCPKGEQFDMGDASGHFTYIEDPDGTLIEFVETHKVPVVKKLGWFIDMKKRDARKVLPKFLFRAMGLVSRQKASK